EVRRGKWERPVKVGASGLTISGGDEREVMGKVRGLDSNLTRGNNLGSHDEIVLIPQIYAGLELNRLLADAAQTQVFRDRHQMDLHLDSRERFANAFSRARRERDHHHRMPGARFIGPEA